MAEVLLFHHALGQTEGGDRVTQLVYDVSH
jgi:hypothetical protein